MACAPSQIEFVNGNAGVICRQFVAVQHSCLLHSQSGHKQRSKCAISPCKKKTGMILSERLDKSERNSFAWGLTSDERQASAHAATRTPTHASTHVSTVCSLHSTSKLNLMCVLRVASGGGANYDRAPGDEKTCSKPQIELQSRFLAFATRRHDTHDKSNFPNIRGQWPPLLVAFSGHSKYNKQPITLHKST